MKMHLSWMNLGIDKGGGLKVLGGIDVEVGSVAETE